MKTTSEHTVQLGEGADIWINDGKTGTVSFAVSDSPTGKGHKVWVHMSATQATTLANGLLRASRGATAEPDGFAIMTRPSRLDHG